MEVHVGFRWGRKIHTKLLFGRPLETSKRRSENNVMMDVRKIQCEGGLCMERAVDHVLVAVV